MAERTADDPFLAILMSPYGTERVIFDSRKLKMDPMEGYSGDLVTGGQQESKEE